MDMKLILPEAGNKSSLLVYQSMKLNVQKEAISEGVNNYNPCPTDLFYWATSNVLPE